MLVMHYLDSVITFYNFETYCWMCDVFVDSNSLASNRP